MVSPSRQLTSCHVLPYPSPLSHLCQYKLSGSTNVLIHLVLSRTPILILDSLKDTPMLLKAATGFLRFRYGLISDLFVVYPQGLHQL